MRLIMGATCLGRADQKVLRQNRFGVRKCTSTTTTTLRRFQHLCLRPGINICCTFRPLCVAIKSNRTIPSDTREVTRAAFMPSV